MKNPIKMHWKHSDFIRMFILLMIISSISMCFMVYQYRTISFTTVEIQNLYDKHMQAINFLRESKANVQAIDNLILRIEFESQAQANYDQLNQNMSDFVENLGVAIERMSVKETRSNLYDAYKSFNPLLDNPISALSTIDLQKIQTMLQAINLNIEDAIEFELADAYDFIIAQQVQRDELLLILEIGLGINCLFVMFYFIYLYRRIVKPIWRLEEAMRRFGHDETLPKPKKQANNEVGMLFSSFVQMGLRIKKNEQSMRDNAAKMASMSKQAGMYSVASEMVHNVGKLVESFQLTIHSMRNNLQSSKFKIQFESIIKSIENNQDAFKNNPRQTLQHFQSMQSLYDNEYALLVHDMMNMRTSIDQMDILLKEQKNKSSYQIVHEQVALSDVVEHCLTMFAFKIPRHVQIQRNIQTHTRVDADRNACVQIIINLLSNAIDALSESTSEQPTISISVEQSGQRILLSIRDNGVGIVGSNLEQIFEQGFTTKKYGQGIGLHHCKSMLSRMNASIEVDSKGIHQGSCFVIQFNAVESNASGVA